MKSCLIVTLKIWCILGWIGPVCLWRLFLDTDFFGQMSTNPQLELVNRLSLWGTYLTFVIWVASCIGKVLYNIHFRRRRRPL